MKRIFFLFSFFYAIQSSFALTTSIKDPIFDYQMTVNPDGSINVVTESSSSSTTVIQGTIPWIDNISQFGGNNVVTGTGNSGPGIPRFTLSNDSSLNNISGTISLPTGAATALNQSIIITELASVATNQTNKSQKTQIIDGSGNVWGPVTTLSGMNYQPVVLAASGASGGTTPSRTIQIGGLGPDGNLHTLSTDNNGVRSTGRGVLSTFIQNYGSSTLSTSAFTTIISSTSVPINEEDIFDNSGGLWYLAYASTCLGLTTASNAIIVEPGGGGKTFAVPAGNCVGFQAIGTSITSGNVYMTFYK